MKSSSIFLLLLPILLQETRSLHCSSSCTYSNTYNPECTLTSDPSNCTSCDPRFYTLSGSTCQLKAKGIFNSTLTIDQSDWSSSTNVVSENIDSESDWLKFNDNDRINAAKIITGAPYGIQCRILMSFEEPSSYSFNPLVYFFISNTKSELIELVPQSNPSSSQQWIFTTKFYNYTDRNLILSLVRSDTSTTTSSDIIAFKDTRCLIAYCVEECLSCTNLNDCTSCDTGFVLTTSRMCDVDCPGGEYLVSTGDFCEMCDNLCELCYGESNNCTLCKNNGPYLSFLFENECFEVCPNNTIPNHLTHTCDCPSEDSYVLSNLTCFSCDPACETCYGTSSSECTTCSLDYFRGLTSSRCAVCGALDTRWFFNHTCLTLCPNGYEGNNATSVCDICPLSMYSFENVCYSECPLYYYANDAVRACVVTNGYPLNLTFEVEDQSTLKFTLKFLVGISSSHISLLNSTTNNFVSLSYRNAGENKHILSSRMLLKSTEIIKTPMMIDSVSVDNTTLILYSSTLSADNLIFSHSFEINFQDNVLSPKNVIYRIDAGNSTDSAPWIVKTYFDANTRFFYLIGALISFAALLLLLVQAKNIHRILIEFIQCIQLLGLTLFSLYPYSSQLDTYSFLTGLDYSNFSFMYNAPATHIEACYECSSLTSYAFVIGDMNWFRMMGSILPCILGVFIFCAVLGLFSFSKEYGRFLAKLCLELVLVKVVHGWFSSLMFVGLNHSNSDGLYNYYLISMHLLSYTILIPTLYMQMNTHKEEKTSNITTLFLILYITLISIISLTPILIGSLLLLISFVEWIYLIKNSPNQKLAVKEIRFFDEHKMKFAIMFHNYVLRSMKPMTIFLISCILLLENTIAIISLVSAILGIYYILIIVDSQLLSIYEMDQAQVTPLDNMDSDEKMGKESTQEHRETEEKDFGIVIYDENSIDGTLNKYNNGNLRSHNDNNSKGFDARSGKGSYYPAAEKSFKKIDGIKEGNVKTYGDNKSSRNIFDEIENKIRNQVAKIRKDETVSRLK